ncbi:fascin domain-containing protein [Paenibacillus lutimineralis]|uniref:DUF7910 domain-containing protein n=1 Tax=Paenibacillus lutimineralis TaxID=2707005 RepID=A0A3Q9IDD9_9BACL|nr:hypothetical protein [Paenibacillus lutimineralis]AZS15579.1 hypothetical protein EI981_14735 [Paenibacillus lutimineralis]
MIISTVTAANYLHRAKVMARSVKRHMPDAKVVVCLVEKDMIQDAVNVPWFDEIVLAKDLGIPHFPQLMLKYNVLEAICAVVTLFYSFLLNRFPSEKYFIHLDSDVQVMNRFDDLIRALDEKPIVLTPHFINSDYFNFTTTRYGVYNAGFSAIRRSGEAKRFVHWWGERSYDLGFVDYIHFANQKWLDLAPGFFDVCSFQHPGYNMAFWNIHERNLEYQDGRYLTNGLPVCFFHYSNSWIQNYLEGSPDPGSPLYQMVSAYLLESIELGQYAISKTPWSYNYFDHGGTVESIRNQVRSNPGLAFKLPDPFKGSHHSLLSDDVFGLQALVNQLWVAAENGGNLPLSANRYHVGPWENFRLIHLDGDRIALQSLANHKYVTAEHGGEGELIANRDHIGSWETFQLLDYGEGRSALKSIANDKFVTVESEGPCTLLPNATEVGLNQLFYISKL